MVESRLDTSKLGIMNGFGAFFMLCVVSLGLSAVGMIGMIWVAIKVLRWCGAL